MQQTQHNKTPFCQQNAIFFGNMPFFPAKLRNKPTTTATNTKKLLHTVISSCNKLNITKNHSTTTKKREDH